MEDEAGVRPEELLRTSPEIAAAYRRSTVQPDDLVLSIGPSFGKAMMVPPELAGANLTQGTARVACGKATAPRYAYWAMRSGFCKQQWEADVAGATFRALNLGPLAETRIPSPPRAQQLAIASFLDRETAKLDALVEKKSALVEKLAEKRSALISRVVTRGLPPEAARTGLDPHPKLKPSGVEWLGKVPEGWGVAPLMRLTNKARPIMYGIVLPGPDVNEGVPIVKGGDVKPGRLTLESLCRTTVEIESGYVRSRLKTDDIVFSIRGSIGEAELVPEEISGANLTQDAARISHSDEVDPVWLLYALKTHDLIDPLLALSLGAAVRGVNIRDLKRVKLPKPPLPEQHAVAAYLDRETAKIDALVAKVETAILRLQEYRAALITAAVTGKIDVRGAVGAAPSAA
jgi:type I restriction enzyme S subunit